MKISYLEARTRDGELLWAEGCDSDGYSYHQIIIPKKYFTASEISNNPYWYCFEKNVNMGEHEAKDYVREYENIVIKMNSIEIQ